MAANPDNRFARYISERNKLRSDNSVKHRAFLPARKHGNNTSVFAVGDLVQHQACDLAKEHVEPSLGRPVLGYAEFCPADVLKAALVWRVDEPPPRHRVIEGWPDAREKQDEAALALASCSKFCGCTTGN